MTICSMQRPPSANYNRRSPMDWADITDEEDLLPPTVTIGPDKNGIKKVIEYKLDEDGKKVKVTTTSRIHTITNSHLSKEALERSSWAKFGDATHQDAASRLTEVSNEEIRIERPKPPGNTETVPATSMKKPGQGEVKCRNCGGSHWTVACPYKDTDQDSNSKPPQTPEVPKGNYVPPNLRAGGGGVRPPQRRNEENSVKVSNLSEDAQEDDLRNLFGIFGPLSRVYIVRDQNTEISRGFGFVNFVRKEDAERAINKLNGYGYDNLILSVEWAPARKTVMFSV